MTLAMCYFYFWMVIQLVCLGICSQSYIQKRMSAPNYFGMIIGILLNLPIYVAGFKYIFMR